MANRIAEAFIELKVRGQQATKRAIDSVKQSAKGLGDGFDSALGKAGTKLDEATEGTRKLQGAITGIIGIVGVVGAAFFKLGNAIFEFQQKLRPASEKVQEFREQLNASGKAASQQADDVRARLEELTAQALNTNEALSRLRDPRTGKAFGPREEIEELTKLLNELNTVEQAREERGLDAQRKAARDLVEQINAATRAQIEANAVALEGDPIKQAELRRAQQLRDLNKEILDTQQALADAEEDKDLNTAARLRDRLALLQQLGQQTNAIINAEIEAFRKATQERIDAENEIAAKREEEARNQRERDEELARETRERALETARVIADANTQAAAQTRQALLDAVSAINSQGPAFSQLEDLVASIADSVQQMKGRL